MRSKTSYLFSSLKTILEKEVIPARKQSNRRSIQNWQPSGNSSGTKSSERSK